MNNASIIIVEDEILIGRDLGYLLEDLGYSVPVVATTSDEALAAITALCPDLVLLDIHLANGSSGLTVAEWLREHGDIPVVFLTAHADTLTIERAQATSPYGYLLKPFNERELAITIQMVLAKSSSDRQLRANERMLATTLRSIADGVIVTNTSNMITYLNPRAEQITGWTSHEAVGQQLSEIFIIQHIISTSDTEETHPSITAMANQLLVLRDGTLRPIEDTIAPIADHGGLQYGMVVVFRDVTERLKTEAEQRHLQQKMLETQRLESLGVLASGLAHDFNNILTSVLCYVQLADEQLLPESEAHKHLEQVLVGIQRATGLTTQMLAYTGHGQSNIRPVMLNTIVRELTALLHARISSHAQLELQLSEDLPPILADAVQINQVILNLLTNAVDAIGEKYGMIHVQTEQVLLTAALARNMTFGEPIIANMYVCVTVRDTGCGMSQETLAKMFDPFFTTKFTGRGLGLAAVQGIIRGHAGAIRVESTLAVGTTFQIYLPIPEMPVMVNTPSNSVFSHNVGVSAQQPSTLLVIDDEPEICVVMTRMLKRMGYKVHTAADGAAGLALLTEKLPQLAGIFVDLHMPGINGLDLVQAIQQMRPGIPLILMSGYYPKKSAGQQIVLRSTRFLQKPFTPATLAATLAALHNQEMLI